MRRPRVAYLALAFAALLFGSTFVVVKEAVTDLPPLGFVGWRFLLGAAAMLLLGIPRGRALWRDGLVAGLLLFAGYATQTVGLAHTTASNSGLITGLYVVFTPLLAAVVARRVPRFWFPPGRCSPLPAWPSSPWRTASPCGRATCSPWPAPSPTPPTSCTCREWPSGTG